MKPAVGPLYPRGKAVCADGLEYSAESEVSLMRTITIIAKFHVEPMNNIKVTANMCIT